MVWTGRGAGRKRRGPHGGNRGRSQGVIPSGKPGYHGPSPAHPRGGARCGGGRGRGSGGGGGGRGGGGAGGRGRGGGRALVGAAVLTEGAVPAVVARGAGAGVAADGVLAGPVVEAGPGDARGAACR